MYELWLTLNIAWEMALALWPGLLAAALLWLALMIPALKRRWPAWRGSLAPTLAVSGLLALSAFVLLPGWMQSALSEMGYWVDWAVLLSLAAAVGGLALAFLWPALAWRRDTAARR